MRQQEGNIQTCNDVNLMDLERGWILNKYLMQVIKRIAINPCHICCLCGGNR